MLPALAGFAAKALLPSGKKIDKDKLLNKKESSAIQKVDGEKGAVNAPTIRKKTISTNLLLPQSEIKEPPSPTEVKKSGSNINEIFDRVGKTLQGIIDSLKNRETNTKEEEKTKKKEANIEEKKDREEKLEKKERKKTPKFSIKTPKDKFNIMRFFGNVLLGSIALAIFNNLEEIISTIKNVFDQIKAFIDKVGEFISPIWNGMKWIVGGGANLIAKIMGIPSQEADTNGIKKNLEEITKKIPVIGDLFKGIQNTIDSIRGYKEPNATSGGGGYSGPETPLGKGETASANRIYSGLVQRGFTKEEAAAITGNIKAESSFRTDALNKSSGAFGLMQWLGGRKTRLIQFAQQKGKPVTDLNVQLDYIVWELMGGNSYETAQFKKAMAYGPDVASKTIGFAYEVERASAAELEGSMSKRVGAAKSVYKSSVQTSSEQMQQSTTSTTQKPTIQSTSQTTTSATTPLAPTLLQQSESTQLQVAPQQSTTTSTTAKVAPEQPSPPMAATVPQIMQQADYEVPYQEPKSTILPIPIGGQSTPTMSSPGGSSIVPIGLSKKEALNSYYQAHLMGFLYKQG